MPSAKTVVLARRGWAAIITLATTAAAIVIPLSLLRENDAELRLDAVLTLLFTFDAYLNFRLDRRRGPRRIAWLLLDLAAALPLGWWTDLPWARVIRLLKLARVAQHLGRWQKLAIRFTNPLRIAIFAYGLSLSAHWLTCGWIALREMSGAPVTYVNGLYWCVTTLTTVGYGDVVPESEGQTLYAIAVMILGVGFYAWLIGNIANIVANLNPARARYAQMLGRVSAFAQYRRLPPDLQLRIRDYFDYVWEQRLGYEEQAVLDALPASLRTEVLLHLKRDVIERVPMFRDSSPEFVRDVAGDLEPVVHMPGDVIVKWGEQAQAMYFISRGRVEVAAADGRHIRYMEDGEFFGEVGLILGSMRTASVRAVTFCDCYRLNVQMWRKLAADHPETARKIEERARSWGQPAATGDDEGGEVVVM